MTVKLTPEQAYAAMFHFIETYCRGNYDLEIGVLLGSMALLPDGTTADPAFVQDWQQSIDFALAGGKAPNLELKK